MWDAYYSFKNIHYLNNMTKVFYIPNELIIGTAMFMVGLQSTTHRSNLVKTNKFSLRSDVRV